MATPTEPNKPDLSSLFIAHGAHESRNEGVCLLEAVAWFAGEDHSDAPECCDVALAAFGRRFNDRIRDDERQLLRPLVPRLVNTKGSLELTRRRASLLVDRYMRSILPAWFRDLPAKPRPDIADRLEALPPVDTASANQACDLARAVRDELRRSLYPAADDAADAYAYADAADAYADAGAAAAAAAADADAYAGAAAYAYAAAAAADAYAGAAAYAAAADAYAGAAAFKALRRKTIERSIASFVDAIELKEAV